MSSVTIENILAQVNQLPPSERAKLLAKLAKESDQKPDIPRSRIICTDAPFADRSREYEWLKQHEREYIGQWVALLGDQLVAQGQTGAEVFARVRELGIQDALVLLVEDPDVPYLGF